MLWMIKRVLNDGWTIEQAGAEATTVGLVNDDPSVPALRIMSSNCDASVRRPSTRTES